MDSLINDKKHTIIGGDFNLPDIDWENRTPKINGKNNKLAKQLLDITDNHSLEQTVLHPTRYNNTLDLHFTNRPSLNISTSVVPGISD